MAISTSMTTSFKTELLSGGHCFNQVVSPSGSWTSGSASVTGVSSMSGVVVGMSVTGTGISGSVVAAITSASAFTLSAPSTVTSTASGLTISGDTFKMALIKNSMSGTYGAATVNYTDLTGNSDETTGTNYSAGGTTLTNVSPTSASTTAYLTFSPNPSWTTATFTTTGCMIYNSSIRAGGTSGTNTTGAGRCCSVHDFGGPQVVSSGTFSVLMPAANSVSALIRIA